MWTAQHQNRSYLSLTCHFINKEWQFKSYILQTKEMDVAHNAINIAEELGIILKEWKIEHKVVAVTTDNAKSVVNATSHLNKMHIPCLGHTLQLGVKKSTRITTSTSCIESSM